MRRISTFRVHLALYRGFIKLYRCHHISHYYLFHWIHYCDPIISIIIGVIIFIGGAKIIRESYLILMESVPQKFDLDEIRAKIAYVEGVADVHELHLWAISSDHYSLTAHVFSDGKAQPLLHYSSH